VGIGDGEAFPGLWLAINPGGVAGTLPGSPAKDPAFGLPAVWIDAAFRDQALASGYTVVDAGSVIATHLNHLMQSNAAQLLGRAETQALLDHFNKFAPKMAEDLCPKLIPLATLQRVLQSLLEEGVHIRDLRTIIEALTEHAAKTQNPAELAAQARIALGRAIMQMLYGPAREVEMLVLEPDLERALTQAAASGGETLGIEPGLAENLNRELAAAAQRLENLGQPPALLVPDKLRLPLARLSRRAAPRLKVIGHAEVPEACTIRVAAVVGARGSLPG